MFNTTELRVMLRAIEDSIKPHVPERIAKRRLAMCCKLVALLDEHDAPEWTDKDILLDRDVSWDEDKAWYKHKDRVAFWDKHIKSWTTYLVDEDDNQVTPADYCPNYPALAEWLEDEPFEYVDGDELIRLHCGFNPAMEEL